MADEIIMTLIERLHTIRAHLQTGALGQREVWEEWLTEAAAEIERLLQETNRQVFARQCLEAEIERLKGERSEEIERLQELNIQHRAEIERLRVEQGVVQEQHAYIERLERLLAADAIRKGE